MSCCLSLILAQFYGEDKKQTNKKNKTFSSSACCVKVIKNSFKGDNKSKCSLNVISNRVGVSGYQRNQMPSPHCPATHSDMLMPFEVGRMPDRKLLKRCQRKSLKPDLIERQEKKLHSFFHLLIHVPSSCLSASLTPSSNLSLLSCEPASSASAGSLALGINSLCGKT